MADLEPLYSIREVAGAFGVSEETIRRWIRAGQIPYTQVGPLRLKRLRPSEIAKEVKNERTGKPDQGASQGKKSRTK